VDLLAGLVRVTIISEPAARRDLDRREAIPGGSSGDAQDRT
jgi:hypothetical protein